MRHRLHFLFALLALLAITCPAWAHTETTRLTLNRPATIKNTTLRPGHYKFVVNPKTDEVRVMRNSRVVATIPGKPVELKNKSPYTAVVFNKRQIHEFEFRGKTQAVKID